MLPLHQGIVYGPVHSRRLGLSLGINVLPRHQKVCTFNCSYCQYGWTRNGATSAADTWPEPLAIARTTGRRQSRQQRALVAVEIGSGRVWTIERDGVAIGSGRNRNGEDGAPEARRQPGVIVWELLIFFQSSPWFATKGAI